MAKAQSPSSVNFGQNPNYYSQPGVETVKPNQLGDNGFTGFKPYGYNGHMGCASFGYNGYAQQPGPVDAQLPNFTASQNDNTLPQSGWRDGTSYPTAGKVGMYLNPYSNTVPTATQGMFNQFTSQPQAGWPAPSYNGQPQGSFQAGQPIAITTQAHTNMISQVNPQVSHHDQQPQTQAPAANTHMSYPVQHPQTQAAQVNSQVICPVPPSQTQSSQTFMKVLPPTKLPSTSAVTQQPTVNPAGAPPKVVCASGVINVPQQQQPLPSNTLLNLNMSPLLSTNMYPQVPLTNTFGGGSMPVCFFVILDCVYYYTASCSVFFIDKNVLSVTRNSEGRLPRALSKRRLYWKQTSNCYTILCN